MTNLAAAHAIASMALVAGDGAIADGDPARTSRATNSRHGK
jgi:hypothetical protein